MRRCFMIQIHVVLLFPKSTNPTSQYKDYRAPPKDYPVFFQVKASVQIQYNQRWARAGDAPNRGRCSEWPPARGFDLEMHQIGGWRVASCWALLALGIGSSESDIRCTWPSAKLLTSMPSSGRTRRSRRCAPSSPCVY